MRKDFIIVLCGRRLWKYLGITMVSVELTKFKYINFNPLLVKQHFFFLRLHHQSLAKLLKSSTAIWNCIPPRTQYISKPEAPSIAFPMMIDFLVSSRSFRDRRMSRSCLASFMKCQLSNKKLRKKGGKKKKKSRKREIPPNG